MNLKKKTFTFLFYSLLFLIASTSMAQQILRLSTTTSTENSGLMTVLSPVFEKKHNIRLDVLAVGTGKALRIGANGDVDVVLVHAPEAELEYVKQGAFINRSAVMHNDFVIVGPVNDPAGIRASNTVIEALNKIAESQSTFVSRGDDSGTNKKEMQLWKLANKKPAGNWYISAGQGMGAVLKMANELQAYTLTDRGTYIAFSDKITLHVQLEGDPPLFNPYHVMAVNPKKHQHVQYDLAKAYINFLTGTQGQKIISDYKKAGQQLFYPDVEN